MILIKEITVYSTPTCPYCDKTKNWLKNNNIVFEDVDVSVNQTAATRMIEESKQMGVPVLKISMDNQIKRIIIGYDIEALQEEFAN